MSGPLMSAKGYENLPHIVLVLRSLGTGGVETHVCQLARGLLARRCRVSLIALCAGPIAPPFLSLGVDIIQLNDNVGQSAKAFANVWRLCRELRRLKPDVVHLHGIRPLLIGGLAGRLARLPHIVGTMHGSSRLMAMNEQGGVSRRRLFFSRLAHAASIVLCTEFITVSPQLHNEALDCLRQCLGLRAERRYAARVSTVLNGIDEFYFVGADRLPPASDPLTIGTIARLEPKKGIDVLLRAFASLVGNGVRAVLLIVGDGGWAAEYEAYVHEAGLVDHVIFAGYQPDVVPFLARMDVFVLPSLSEGLPLVILEAMAMGVPVVATQVGGVPSVVKEGETGLLVPPGDAVALAKALCRMVNDEGLQRSLSQAAYALVSRQHRESQMVDGILEAYHLSNDELHGWQVRRMSVESRANGEQS